MRSFGATTKLTNKHLKAIDCGAPGAIPTRDLPLRSRIHEPFVFNSYEKAFQKCVCIRCILCLKCSVCKELRDNCGTTWTKRNVTQREQKFFIVNSSFTTIWLAAIQPKMFGSETWYRDRAVL